MFSQIVSVLKPALDLYFPDTMNVRIIAEPGRYFVASAFTLAVNVIARRAISKEDANDLGIFGIQHFKVIFRWLWYFHIILSRAVNQNVTKILVARLTLILLTCASTDLVLTLPCCWFGYKDESDMALMASNMAANEDPSYMYYVNDGVYGSFNCILFDHATVEPTLVEVCFIQTDSVSYTLSSSCVFLSAIRE